MMTTILIVDDEKAITRYLSEGLEKEGYKVDTAESGTEALKKLSNIPYEIVILDLKLPDIWGGEIVEYIHSQLPGTKTFIFSTLTESEIMESDPRLLTSRTSLKGKVLRFFDKGNFDISEIEEEVKKASKGSKTKERR